MGQSPPTGESARLRFASGKKQCPGTWVCPFTAAEDNDTIPAAAMKQSR